LLPLLPKLAGDLVLLLLCPQTRRRTRQLDTYEESHTASVTSFWKELSLPKERGTEMSHVYSHQELEQTGSMGAEV
jgi:hypothetical protein